MPPPPPSLKLQRLLDRSPRPDVMNGFIRLFSFHTEGQLLFFLYRRHKLKPWSLCSHRHETGVNHPANVTGTRATMIKTVFYEDRLGWPFSVGEFYPRLLPPPLF